MYAIPRRALLLPTSKKTLRGARVRSTLAEIVQDGPPGEALANFLSSRGFPKRVAKLVQKKGGRLKE